MIFIAFSFKRRDDKELPSIIRKNQKWFSEGLFIYEIDKTSDGCYLYMLLLSEINPNLTKTISGSRRCNGLVCSSCNLLSYLLVVLFDVCNPRK